MPPLPAPGAVPVAITPPAPVPPANGAGKASVTVDAAGNRPIPPPAGQTPPTDEVLPGPAKAATEAPLDPSAGQRSARPAPRRQTPQVYDQAVARAQKSLAEERPADELPPHPLAVANPDFNVVVCFAGCGAERDRVVFFKKRFASGLTPVQSGAAPAVIKVADVQQPAPLAGQAAGGTEPACVAGCYANDPAARRGRSGGTEGSISGRIPSGTWITTQTKADPFEGKAAPDATAKRPAAAKAKPSSSEWFTKRF